MRDIGMMAKTVQLSLRTTDLRWFDRQMILKTPTMIAAEITAAGMELLRKNFRFTEPLRSIGIRGMNLVPISSSGQVSLFEDENRRHLAEKLEYAIDGVRKRYGYKIIHRALCIKDSKIGQLDAKADNTVHPIGYS
jgi:DNA polymerase-4